MSWRRSRIAEEEPNYWPAVADVFIGFLALMLLAVIAPYLVELAIRELGGEYRPPMAKDRFRVSFIEAFNASLAEGGSKPSVDDFGFSELKLYFPAAFLFNSCQTKLKQPGREELEKLKGILKDFEAAIQRVQIAGHTDIDRPGPGGCGGNAFSNWELSALRAITVLTLLAPDDKSGLDPHKVWGSALGEYSPVDQRKDEAAKARNRRIELIIRFVES